MATFLTQAQLWPGVETAEVSIRQERVEVTALGDRERRFMAGPTTVEVSLRLGATAYEQLMGILATKPEYDPNSDFLIFRVPMSKIANAPGVKRTLLAPEPLELRPVRLLTLED